MKYFFSLLLLLSLSYSASSQCTYVIDMQDSFGDGWNGGTLDVSINSVFFASYTLANGTTGQVTFPAANLDVVQFTYTAGGFPTEVSYQISVGGSQLFADGQPVATQPAQGVVFTHQCGGCDPAGSLVASNLAATSADIGWTPAGGGPTGWYLEYGPIGFTPGSGTFVTSVANPQTLSGLMPSSTYDAYVYSICSSGDTSLPAGPVTFSTLCLPVTVYPFWEGFNSTSPTENCWTVLNANGDFDEWNMDNTNNPFEGDECATINTDFNNGLNNDFLISPQLTLTGGERIRFRHRCNSTFEPNDFELVMSTTGINPGDFTTVLHTDTSDAVTYEEVVVPLYGIVGNVYLAFRIPPGGLDGWVLYIDDILIEQPTVNDAGVSALVQPVLPTPGGFTPVEVEVTNYGIGTLNSFTVEWEIDGVAQPSVPYSGPPIALGDKTVMNLANLNLPSSTLNLKFWTSMPNAVVDEDFSNDTLDLRLCPGLSGTYSVGHASSDFPTAQEAIDALMSCGVSGPVTMEFQTGTYNGPWILNRIPGANATNTVTFDGLNSANATLTHTGFGINTAATLILDGSAYFSIKNFTITSTGINTAYGVLFINNAHHNTVEDNIITVPTGAGLTNVVAVLASADYADSGTGTETEGNNANWNLIKNNDISGGLSGIVLEGGELDNPNVGNQIVGNRIHNAQNYGVYVDEQDSFMLSGNRIYDINATTSDAAMLFDIHNYIVSGNDITAQDYGIAIFGAFNDPCMNGIIVNNMISTSLTSGEGLYLNDVFTALVYHNTLRGWRAFFVDDHVFVDFRNNIMTTANGECFYNIDNVSMGAMDHNLYNVTGSGNVVRFGPTTYNTLANWQAAPIGYDPNSVSGNPGYVNGLHVSSALPVDAGDPALTIPVLEDFDGESRPMGALPDIGADEHIVIANDAMAVGLVAPMGCGSTSHDVIVEIANLGSNVLVSAPVAVNVSGAAIANFNSTQPLIMPAATNQINMGTLNTSAGGTFNFEIIVSSSVDGNPSNDTAWVTVNILPSNQNALTMTGDNIVCSGNRATIAANASYAPATILWYDAPTGGNLVHIGSTFNTAGPLMATTMYYAEVQGCNSPRAIATVMVDTVGINVDLGADVSICGGQVATVTPTITLSPEVSIQWSEGSQSAFLNVTTAGQYNVVVTNANGCTDSDTIDVAVSAIPTITSNSITNVSCGGFSDGAIDLNVAGGTGPFSYMWSNNATTEDLNAIGGGVYNVTVTDNGPAGGCSYVQTYQVTEPTTLSTNVDATGIACTGADGSIDISVFGGSPNYTYNWTNGATTQNITNATGGAHTVTVTDANGCTSTATTNVTASTPITIVVDSVYDEILALAGGIDVTATGGTGTLVYTWNNGATTANVTGLTAGTYSVTVTDLATGCQQVMGNIVIVYKIPDFVENISALNAFKLYPNPTSGQVWVNMTLAESTNVQLEIMTVTGQLLQSFAPNEALEQNYTINLSDYPSGVYLARFIIGNEVMTTKIIVE